MSKIQSLLQQEKLRNRQKRRRPPIPQDVHHVPSDDGYIDAGHSPKDIVDAITRNKSVFAWTVGASLLAGIMFLMLATPQYRAETLVLIEPQGTQAGELQPVVQGLNTDAETVQSETYIIDSIELASRVFGILGLETDSEFISQPSLTSRVLDLFSGSETEKNVPVAAVIESSGANGNPSNEQLQKFRDFVDVGVLADSRVISIRFRSSAPDKAGLVANTLAKEYLGLREDLKLESSGKFTSWLDDQISDLMENVQSGEVQIESLRQKYGIVEGARGELSAQEMGQISTQLIIARAESASINAQLEQARRLKDFPAGIQSASEVLNSRLIQQLRADEIDMQGQLAEQSSELGDRHPRMLQLKAEIADLQMKISTEIDNVVAGLEYQYNVAIAKERSVEADLTRIKQSVASVNQREIEIRSLEREVEANQTLLTNLLRRQKETEPQNENHLLKADARIISRALPPRDAFFPSVKLTIGSSLFLGFLLSGLIIIFRETFNPSILTVEELVACTGERVLGFVPKVDFSSAGSASEIDYLVKNPTSAVAESIRTIIWNIKLSASNRFPQVVAIMSSTSDEGKTTLANLFGVTQSKSGSSVLILDADIRKPSMHDRYNTDLKPGLSDYLAGDAAIDEIISQYDSDDKLDVITAGPKVDDIAGLLGSDRLKRLIDELRNRYDTILIDTPPVLAASDAQLISKAVDAVILVAKWDQTSGKMLKHALNSLSLSNTPVIGAVLSAVDGRQYSYYGYR